MIANYILVTLFFIQIIVSDGGWVRKLHPDGKCGDLELPDWIIPMALSAGNCSRGTCAELGYNSFLEKTQVLVGPLGYRSVTIYKKAPEATFQAPTRNIINNAGQAFNSLFPK